MIPSPLQIKAALVAAAVMAIAILTLLVWGLYWRGEYREAKAALTVYAGQAAINKEAAERCSAGAEEAKRVGEAAIAAMGPMVAAARAAAKDRTNTAQTLEELARQKRQSGEGCDWAWGEIEQQKRKARAAP